MRDYNAMKLGSIRLTLPPICAYTLPNNTRAYINYASDESRILSLTFSFSFFASFSLSFFLVSRKSRIEFIKNTTGSPWDDRDEEKVNAKLSCVYVSNDIAFLVITFRNRAYSHGFHSGQINRQRQAL